MAKVTAIKSKNKSKSKSSSNSSAALAKQLALVLSDTYVLAVKTHGYHWNVTGPSFGSLHTLFEQQYAALIINADDIAERIRTFGYYPDGSMDSFTQNTVVKEASTKQLSAEGMLKDLYKSYDSMRERMVEAEDLADDLDDLATQDLMTQQIREHDKVMWMLKSHYE